MNGEEYWEKPWDGDFPWCGCGEPERVAEAMLSYLTPTDPEHPTILIVDDSLDRLLLAYMADGEGWTEHGSTVRAAWLTEAGKQVVAALQRGEY